MIRALLSILLSALPLCAATWYYDTAAVGSANTGTSWANAWTNYASIVWAGGGVNGDDTLYISGGTTSQTYTAGFNVGVNGSAGHTVTISVGVDAGHDGVAIFDGANTNTALGGFINGAIYSRIVGPKTNLLVCNMVTSSSDREQGIALYAGSPHDQSYSGLILSNANNGFYFNTASNIVVSNCVGRAIRGDYSVRFNGNYNTNFTGLILHDCDFLMNADFSGSNGGPDGVGCANSVTMYANRFKWTNGAVTIGQHPDGIQSLGGYIKVYGNYFANPLNSCIKFEPLSPTTQFIECYAWDNVGVADDATYAASGTFNGKGFELGSGGTMTNVQNVILVHNTFVDLLGLAINGGNGTWPVTAGTYLMENNAFYNCGKNTGGSLYSAVMGNSNVVFNFNSLKAGATGTTNLSIDLPGNGVFSNYIQTNTPSGLTFTSYSAYNSANNLVPTASVPGVNLGAYAITTDYNGTPRNTNAPTAGAFEWASSALRVGGTVQTAGRASTAGRVTLQ